MPSLVRRHCLRLALYLILLLVRMRIQLGIGRFWRCFLASFCFVRKDLWDGIWWWRRRRQGGGGEGGGI